MKTVIRILVVVAFVLVAVLVLIGRGARFDEVPLWV